MTLNCSADNCVYNNSGTCYAGKIIVSGVDASSSVGTCCAMFSSGNNSLTNLSSNCFTTSKDIDCKAKRCYYNEEGTCVAESVHINHENAQCDTFIND